MKKILLGLCTVSLLSLMTVTAWGGPPPTTTSTLNWLFNTTNPASCNGQQDGSNISVSCRVELPSIVTELPISATYKELSTGVDVACNDPTTEIEPKIICTLSAPLQST